MPYGPSGFVPLNVTGNFLAGRQAADDEKARGYQNILREQAIEQNTQESQQRQQTFTEEQQRKFATTMVQAAQYGLQSQTPKAFIEQNYPQLVQLAGPQWEQLDDNGVKQKLQDAIGHFGPMAGIGPAQPQEPGPLEQYIGDDGSPVFGTRREAIGRRPYDKPPQVVQQFTPVQTDVGIGSFNSRTGQVTPTGVKAAPKEPKPPSETDKKARVLLASMENAEKDIANLKDVDTGSITQAMLGSNRVTAPMQSDAFRKYEAAGLRWAANLLYLKSGATATPDEIRSTWKQFFPQPGDGDEVKAQKAASRQQEVGAIQGVYTPGEEAQPQQPSGQPVRVRSAQEAMALPPGTVFITPDGRQKVRP